VIRQKIAPGLERSLTAFQDLAAEISGADSRHSDKGTSAGSAAVAVSLIIGYPVQAMIDPEHVGAGEYLAAVRGALGQLGMAA
jgi:hypothetical protein